MNLGGVNCLIGRHFNIYNKKSYLVLDMEKIISPQDDVVNVIIVDDSLAFRWTLRNLLADSSLIAVAGEASNGIEALELIIKAEPDVILMDFEMPLMDGMTALQHLMIHTPTPTIMFSRLTKEGTARCFDALKNGAVDFFCKDNLCPGKIAGAMRDEIIEKIICASSVEVKAVEPMFVNEPKKDIELSQSKQLVFCEECGSKKEIGHYKEGDKGNIICNKCGEHMVLEQGSKYIRTSFMSIIAAGEGAYINLLKLIPHIPSGINGSLLILIDGTVEHVDAFTDYLDAISTVNVIRIQDGLSIEGGNCYVGCDNECIFLKPYSAHYTLKFSKEYYSDIRPMDMTIKSIAKVLKNRTAAIFLSGEECEGDIGVEVIHENQGSTMVLDPKQCLYKVMGQNIIDKYPTDIIADEEDLAKKIIDMHFRFKDMVVTA